MDQAMAKATREWQDATAAELELDGNGESLVSCTAPGPFPACLILVVIIDGQPQSLHRLPHALPSLELPAILVSATLIPLPKPRTVSQVCIMGSWGVGFTPLVTIGPGMHTSGICGNSQRPCMGRLCRGARHPHGHTGTIRRQFDCSSRTFHKTLPN